MYTGGNIVLVTSNPSQRLLRPKTSSPPRRVECTERILSESCFHKAVLLEAMTMELSHVSYAKLLATVLTITRSKINWICWFIQNCSSVFDLLIRAIKHVEHLDLHPRFTAGVNKSDRHTLYTRTSVKWNIHKKNVLWWYLERTISVNVPCTLEPFKGYPSLPKKLIWGWFAWAMERDPLQFRSVNLSL